MEKRYNNINVKYFLFCLILIFLVNFSSAMHGEGIYGNPYQITNCTELQSMTGSNYYVLMNDINCAGINFVPIGGNNIFSGDFNGFGYTISNLSISNKALPNFYRNVGLFGSLSGSVRNLKLNANILGSSNVAGELANAGGIAGTQNSGSIISNCFFSGTVYSKSNVGGIVGYSSGIISESHSSGSVSGNYYSSLSANSYLSAGGLVGLQTSSGEIINSYSNVSVSVGEGYPSAIQKAGGLVGKAAGKINNSYFYGTASARAGHSGGIIAISNNATVTNSYWDVNKSRLITSAGGEGKTTLEMFQESTYVDWDTNVWDMFDGSYPTLGDSYVSVDKNNLTLGENATFSINLFNNNSNSDYSTGFYQTQYAGWIFSDKDGNVFEEKEFEQINNSYQENVTITPSSGNYILTAFIIQYNQTYDEDTNNWTTSNETIIVQEQASIIITGNQQEELSVNYEIQQISPPPQISLPSMQSWFLKIWDFIVNGVNALFGLN